MGSTLGLTLRMRADPKSLLMVLESSRSRWPAGVSAPSFLGIHTLRSLLRPRMSDQEVCPLKAAWKAYPRRKTVKATPWW